MLLFPLQASDNRRKIPQLFIEHLTDSDAYPQITRIEPKIN